MAKPWVGYVRVSSVGGRAGEAFRSPDDQAAAIRAWCKARGERVVLLPPELDESGGREDRPILADAIAGVERGDYRGIVALNRSRVARNLRHIIELYDRFKEIGAEIRLVEGDADETTPEGELNRNFMASFDEYQRVKAAEGFARVKAASVAAGVWSRKPPIGYDRDPETRKLIPNADAERVRRAFADRAAGRPILAIADDLGMTRGGAANVLKSRAYLGEIHAGPNVNLAAHEPIVSAEIFDAVQRAFTRRPPRGDAPERSLLAGLVRCAACGFTMTRHKGAKGPGGANYWCSGRHSAGHCPERTLIRMPLLDEYVTGIALRELEAIRGRGARNEKEIRAAREELHAAESELAAYVVAVSAADIGAEAFGDGARLRRDRLDVARDALRDLMAREDVTLAGDPVAMWDELSTDQRNRLLSGLLEAVVVRRGQRGNLDDRVRVVARGAGIFTRYRGGGAAAPLRRIDFDDPRIAGAQLA